MEMYEGDLGLAHVPEESQNVCPHRVSAASLWTMQILPQGVVLILEQRIGFYLGF